MTLTNTFNGASHNGFGPVSAPLPIRDEIQVEKSNKYAERTRQRIPNKTQWGLTDMMTFARKLRAEMEQTLYWIDRERIDAKGKCDRARLERLGELSQQYAKSSLYIAELERIAADTAAGRYEQPNSADDRK